MGAMLQVLVIVSRQCEPRTNLAFSRLLFPTFLVQVLSFPTLNPVAIMATPVVANIVLCRCVAAHPITITL
ncbi:hypothetical protein EDD16DRAFT_1633589 [Pisolithus croceorrhizus]|nr:hypothetical protein EV401DRAFT_2045531 [Pisolithus croceorrhizus]KAI6105249.1 hypothetical protein EDD16DRAFT_1633589 [Pisolithus croceorrhizus]